MFREVIEKLGKKYLEFQNNYDKSYSEVIKVNKSAFSVKMFDEITSIRVEIYGFHFSLVFDINRRLETVEEFVEIVSEELNERINCYEILLSELWSNEYLIDIFLVYDIL